jgi:hypothetical protein
MTVEELAEQLKDYNPEMEVTARTAAVSKIELRVIGGGDSSKLEILIPEGVTFHTREYP